MVLLLGCSRIVPAVSAVRRRWQYAEVAMRAAIYVRVSTADQNFELQLRDLHEYVLRQGWEIAETYRDVVSGSKSTRPALSRLMADAKPRKFDCVVCWKLDRFGRSLVDCLNNLKELDLHGVRFIATTQGLDTDN